MESPAWGAWVNSRWGKFSSTLIGSVVSERWCLKFNPKSTNVTKHFTHETSTRNQAPQYGSWTEAISASHGQENRQGSFQLQREQKCRCHGKSIDYVSNPTQTRLTDFAPRFSWTISFSCKRERNHTCNCPQLPADMSSRLVKEAAIESKQGGERGITARSVRKVTAVSVPTGIVSCLVRPSSRDPRTLSPSSRDEIEPANHNIKRYIMYSSPHREIQDSRPNFEPVCFCPTCKRPSQNGSIFWSQLKYVNATFKHTTR